MAYEPKHRARTTEDDLFDMFEKIRLKNIERYKSFERSFCQEFSDGMDGFVIHAPECALRGDTAVSSSACIRLTLMTRWPVGLSEAR